MPKAPIVTKEFTTAYEQLNTAQRQAVDTIDGAVMVIAGPGTGKTQTIALRVANILKQTQMRPSNILCLTFSTSGVKAMRERLRHFIGPDAYGVTVQTVHGFCNDVIQQHPDVFAEWRTLEQISEIERLRIVRAGIATLPIAAILRRPRAGQDRAMSIVRRIDELKRENVRPADLHAVVEPFLADIAITPTGKDRNKDTAAYKNDLQKVAQFKEFIQVYEHYQAELRSSHRYDFSDMVLTCLDALKANDWLLAPLQEQYQYVLVDEFQDLNTSQFSIIQTLINYVHTDQTPNIFCVGDDDQAIYRFQGANLGNMQAFIGSFPQATIITLTNNYRSNQLVLNAASNVIDYNEGRLVRTVQNINKDLIAAANVPDCMPTLDRYPSIEVQYAGIAQLLTEKHTSGVPWSDMAIIARRNADVLEAAEFLTTVGIPCDIKAKRDLTKQTEVLQLIALLKAIVEPSNSILLSNALSAPLLAVPSLELAKLWTSYRSHQRDQDTETVPLLQFILESESMSDILHCAEHTQKLWQWHTKLPHQTVPELLQEILLYAKLIPQLGAKHADPLQLGIVYAFYEYVKSRCYEQKSVTIRQLIADLEEFMQEDGLSLQYEIPHLVTDGVQLLTAHAAKGLEFTVVVVPNAWSGNWGKRRVQSDLSLPMHLIFKHDKANEKELNQEDERRLFYVALTRAKECITITVPEKYRSGEVLKVAEVSGFIAEAADAMTESVRPPDSLPEPIIPITPKQTALEPEFKEFLQQRVEQFELSVTALNVFLDDPERFLWEQLLQQPKAKQAHLAYGTAVHAALEHYALARKNHQECSAEQIINAFTNYIETRELMTAKEREEYVHLGKGVLQSYAEDMLQNQPHVLYTERQLKARLDDIPLKGKVDRIDILAPDSRQIRIVDYKTGGVKTEAAVRKDENLFRQLVFYKILADNAASFPFEATKFCLDFVGNDKATRRVVELEVTQQDVQELEATITNVWQKITNLDFTPID